MGLERVISDSLVTKIMTGHGTYVSGQFWQTIGLVTPKSLLDICI